MCAFHMCALLCVRSYLCVCVCVCALVFVLFHACALIYVLSRVCSRMSCFYFILCMYVYATTCVLHSCALGFALWSSCDVFTGHIRFQVVRVPSSSSSHSIGWHRCSGWGGPHEQRVWVGRVCLEGQLLLKEGDQLGGWGEEDFKELPRFTDLFSPNGQITTRCFHGVLRASHFTPSIHCCWICVL